MVEIVLTVPGIHHHMKIVKTLNGLNEQPREVYAEYLQAHQGIQEHESQLTDYITLGM